MGQQPQSVQQQPTDTASLIIEDVARRVHLPSSITPRDAIQAVMCTFTRHVSRGEAARVFEVLPKVVQPLLERCMLHRDEPAKRFGRNELLDELGAHLGVSVPKAEEIASAVLHAVSSRLPAQELGEVTAQLPRELRDLWVIPKIPVGTPVEPHPILSRSEQTVALPRGVTGIGAFTSVMRHLSRRLSLGEARHLCMALPSDLRQLLEDSLLGRGEHPVKLGKGEFLERVGQDLGISEPREVEMVAKAVFKHVEDHLPASVFKHVSMQLPRELSDLWALPY